MTIQRLALTATVFGLIALTGCTATSTDKAGGDTVVLRLASIDKINNNGQSFGPQAFVDQLAQVSGGRLKVEVTTTFGEGTPTAESDLVTAIATGKIDGGWPSTRAFAAADIPGLKAVEAPMTLTSYAAVKDLVSGETAEHLLTTLDDSGVVGLGLAVGPLRRPFAAKSALLGPDDWNGIRFRAYNSPVQTDTIEALGANPVNLSLTWIEEVRAGRLRGAEFDVAQYAANGLTVEAGHVTSNVVLWPKVFVLSLSQSRYDALSDQQRAWVDEAAKRAVEASVNATYDEESIVDDLCSQGVNFTGAAPSDLLALRTAFKPVIDGLAADPTTAPLLAEIQAIAAVHPTPDVLDTCAPDAAETEEVGPVPEQVAAIPDGVYRTSVSEAEIQDAGLTNEGGISGVWTLTIRRGAYELTCRPLDLPGIDCGSEESGEVFEAGEIRGTGDVAYFHYLPARLAELNGCELPASATAPGHCYPLDDFKVTWRLEGKELALSQYGNTWRYEQYLIKPWQKID